MSKLSNEELLKIESKALEMIDEAIEIDMQGHHDKSLALFEKILEMPNLSERITNRTKMIIEEFDNPPRSKPPGEPTKLNENLYQNLIGHVILATENLCRPNPKYYKKLRDCRLKMISDRNLLITFRSEITDDQTKEIFSFLSSRVFKTLKLSEGVSVYSGVHGTEASG